jgi:hypothetical protein
MDDLTKILLTSSLTVLGGVFIFVAGQLLGKFIIEPVQDLKKLLGEIRFALIFYAPAILTPTGDKAGEEDAQKALRRTSCDLRSKVEAIPFYGTLSFISCGFLPYKKKAFKASTLLMGLSNSVHQPDRSDKNTARITKIEGLLNYEPIEE